MNPDRYQKVKALVHTSPLLTVPERDEWLMLLELMNDKQLTELEKILSFTPPATNTFTSGSGVHLSHLLNMPSAFGSKPGAAAASPVAELKPQVQPIKPSSVAKPVITQPENKPEAGKSKFGKWLKSVVEEKELPAPVVPKAQDPKPALPVKPPVTVQKPEAPKVEEPKPPVLPPIQIVIMNQADGSKEVKVQGTDGSELASQVIQKPQIPVEPKPKEKEPEAKKPEPIVKPSDLIKSTAKENTPPVVKKPELAEKPAVPAEDKKAEPSWKNVTTKKIGSDHPVVPGIAPVTVTATSITLPDGPKTSAPTGQTGGLSNIPFNFNGGGGKTLSMPTRSGAAPVSMVTKPLFAPADLLNQPPFLTDVQGVVKINLDDWRKKRSISVGGTLLYFIRIHGYHTVMSQFEHSSLYGTYINTGLKLLASAKTFDQWETERKDADQFFTKREFEEFTDMMRVVQSLS